MDEFGKRLKSWASILEDNTREQAERTATMPFVFPHVALMPDAHLGLGATIGSVIPTTGAIIPAAIGTDLGCGVYAVLTQFTTEHTDGLGRSNLRRMIEDVVPLGRAYNTTLTASAEKRSEELHDYAYKQRFDPDVPAENWDLQLGSLGGGNHFIEVVADEQDRIWLFLHSGSRGIGNKIAGKHIKIAQELCEKWWIPLPDKNLAYLAEGTDEFWTYMRQARWAQKFAWMNREEMMDRVAACFFEWIGEDVVRQQEVHTHHNYVEQENHFNRNVWVTRKGAIRARAGDMGLIPGSMGTASYVVEGLGNPVALHSAPHGAGRVHSRRSAKRTFSYEQLREAMDDNDIEWSGSEAFLDEIPDAYKPVDVVMEDARELVRTVHTFRQIINIKGSD